MGRNAAAGLPSHDVDELKQCSIDVNKMVLSEVSSVCESMKF